jgi:hypothetical protein
MGWDLIHLASIFAISVDVDGKQTEDLRCNRGCEICPFPKSVDPYMTRLTVVRLLFIRCSVYSGSYCSSQRVSADYAAL